MTKRELIEALEALDLPDDIRRVRAREDSTDALNFLCSRVISGF